MNTRETDKIFKDYNSGEKNLDETNKALNDMGAGFHLENLTDEERAEKKRREDEAGTVYNPDFKGSLPQKVDMSRRTDLIGAPGYKRCVIQETAHGKFAVTYDEQGYAINSSRVDSDN